MAEKVSALYRIVCVKNGDYYYGSSDDVRRRWNTHKSSLRLNKHSNIRLQRVFNKYGENSFRFEIVELLPKEQLIDFEQRYLNEHLGRPHCVNISSTASHPTITHTNEAKTKISEASLRNMKRKEYVETLREKSTAFWTQPENRSFMSNTVKKWWSVPENREKMVQAARARWAKRR